jgi:hypothetical protein
MPALGDKTRYRASLDDGFGKGSQKVFEPDMFAKSMTTGEIQSTGKYICLASSQLVSISIYISLN